MWRGGVPRPLAQCSMLAAQQAARDHRSEARLRIDAKVLVIVESAYSRLGRDIAELLVANRIRRWLIETLRMQTNKAYAAATYPSSIERTSADISVYSPLNTNGRAKWKRNTISQPRLVRHVANEFLPAARLKLPAFNLLLKLDLSNLANGGARTRIRRFAFTRPRRGRRT
ncbi:hypothetical protein EVAR_23854_1 [Eumeta japonica]|uniref:Heparan sulfate-N-deacetylase N-terminal domain-containing protein n=1 Tax=Eumeta variegata TaxID=151549 RepID=A0A4C1V3V7_EUMVA|nr:hypothetical protein EVAR_23854_1 [Eumeta japonica]